LALLKDPHKNRRTGFRTSSFLSFFVNLPPAEAHNSAMVRVTHSCALASKFLATVHFNDIRKGREFMMRRVGFIFLAVLLFAGLASAQIPTSGNVFFGYSYYNTDLSSVNRANMNGWEASVEGKIIPWIGAVADFDSHYSSQNLPVCLGSSGTGVCSSFNVSVAAHNYLFGPRVSISVGKLRPFAEALFGASHIDAGAVGSDTSFATALGGGLDYKIIRPIAWRFQGDYVQTRFFSATQNNVRLSTGIVLRF
jgi:hypothetical protein